jgi:hypothetical protein
MADLPAKLLSMGQLDWKCDRYPMNHAYVDQLVKDAASRERERAEAEAKAALADRMRQEAEAKAVEDERVRSERKAEMKQVRDKLLADEKTKLEKMTSEGLSAEQKRWKCDDFPEEHPYARKLMAVAGLGGPDVAAPVRAAGRALMPSAGDECVDLEDVDEAQVAQALKAEQTNVTNSTNISEMQARWKSDKFPKDHPYAREFLARAGLSDGRRGQVAQWLRDEKAKLATMLSGEMSIMQTRWKCDDFPEDHPYVREFQASAGLSGGTAADGRVGPEAEAARKVAQWLKNEKARLLTMKSEDMSRMQACWKCDQFPQEHPYVDACAHEIRSSPLDSDSVQGVCPHASKAIGCKFGTMKFRVQGISSVTKTSGKMLAKGAKGAKGKGKGRRSETPEAQCSVSISDPDSVPKKKCGDVRGWGGACAQAVNGINFMIAYGEKNVAKLQTMVINNVYKVDKISHRNTLPAGATCNSMHAVVVENEVGGRQRGTLGLEVAGVCRNPQVLTNMMCTPFALPSMTVKQMGDAKMTRSSGCGMASARVGDRSGRGVHAHVG